MNKCIMPESTITCPECGHRKKEAMPTDACQWFYACEACHALLKPDPGDCCVFCSFGDVPCPPVQEGRDMEYDGALRSMTANKEQQ